MRSDPIRLKDSMCCEETRFYHQQFRRDQPELLGEIRKPSQVESADKQDVETLRLEVIDLKRGLDVASDDVERLTQLVNSINQGNLNMSSAYGGGQAPMVSDAGIYENALASQDGVMSAEMEPYPLATCPALIVTSVTAPDPNDDGGSTVPSFFPATANDTIALLEEPIVDDSSQVGPSSGADPLLVERLHNALSALPQEMQNLLVERIVASVVDPASFQAQVDAMTALAASAVHTASLDRLETHRPMDQETVHLATSVLGAYVECIKKKHQPV